MINITEPVKYYFANLVPRSSPKKDQNGCFWNIGGWKRIIKDKKRSRNGPERSEIMLIYKKRSTHFPFAKRGSCGLLRTRGVEGGGQLPFGTFPKSYPFWYPDPSLRSMLLLNMPSKENIIYNERGGRDGLCAGYNNLSVGLLDISRMKNLWISRTICWCLGRICRKSNCGFLDLDICDLWTCGFVVQFVNFLEQSVRRFVAHAREQSHTSHCSSNNFSP